MAWIGAIASPNGDVSHTFSRPSLPFGVTKTVTAIFAP
jgi:hypothetical protein